MKNFSWTLVALLALSWSCAHSRSIDTPQPTSFAPEEAPTSLPGTTQERRMDVMSEKEMEGIAEKILAAAVEQAAETETKKEMETELEVEEEMIKEILSAMTKEFDTEAQKETEVSTSQDAAMAALGPLADLINTPQQSQLSPLLDFEGGSGDNDNSLSEVRDKRTIGLLRNLLGGGRAQSRSGGDSKQKAFNRQMRQWIQYQKATIKKLNETEGGNYTTPFPILPPSPPEEDESESSTERPGFIANLIKFKLNFIPRLFRTVLDLFRASGPALQNLRGGSNGLFRTLFGGNREGISSRSLGGNALIFGRGSNGGSSSYSSPSDLSSYSGSRSR